MLKLNIIYTMMYQNSYFDMSSLIEHEVKQKHHKQGIENLLDKYFTADFQSFYDELC